MDERFHEMAVLHEQALRDEAVRRAQQDACGTGQPYCEDCGELIPDARRNAHPAALRCIACQTVFEHLKKGMHDARYA